MDESCCNLLLTNYDDWFGIQFECGASECLKGTEVFMSFVDVMFCGEKSDL